MPYEKIAALLFLDDGTIRRYEKEYQEGGLDALIKDHYQGATGNLSATQEAELKLYLANNAPHRAKDICGYI